MQTFAKFGVYNTGFVCLAFIDRDLPHLSETRPAVGITLITSTLRTLTVTHIDTSQYAYSSTVQLFVLEKSKPADVRPKP